ncbi:MAG TPA: histidine kinase, partial [Balneolaceae bacterium]|nr:histidine kinase [Balneolaceae bacterium]
MFHHLSSSAHRLQYLVEDLLSWASLQNGKMKPDLEEIDFDVLAVQILELLKDSAQQKDIDISFESSAKTPVCADRNMLKTIVRNFISNAIKFTEPGGSVSLVISQMNSTNIIEVKDDGIGMK